MTGRVAVWAVAVVAVVAIGLITACDPADPPVPNAATERVADGREYWGLASAPEHEAPRNHPDGYRREDWSVSWPDDVNVALGWKTDGCRWAFYAAKAAPACLTNPTRDHLVAVAEAHRSGGYKWSHTDRREFYTDTENLFVLSAAENRKKSAHDPAGWLPERKLTWCKYVTEWLYIKRKWGLSADLAELDAIRRVVQETDCDPNHPAVRNAPAATTVTTAMAAGDAIPP